MDLWYILWDNFHIYRCISVGQKFLVQCQLTFVPSEFWNSFNAQFMPRCHVISQTIKICPLLWLRMIDDVGRPMRCEVSSLNNHKLLQFLQHSRAPLVFHFSFSLNASSYETFPPPYILYETKGQICDEEQSLLNVVAMVSFHYGSCRVL